MSLQLKLPGVRDDQTLDVEARATGAAPGPADHPAYTTLPSPIGPVLVGFSGHRVTMLAPAGDMVEFERRLQRRDGRAASRTDEAPEWLRAAVATTDGTGLDYDLEGLSRFERAVLAQTAAIPSGEVRPYAWVAAGIGLPGSVRAVGRALHHNPVPLLIPCHRVVRSDGSLGGYALGPEAKRTLLAAEGADVGWLDRLAAGRVRFLGSPASRRWCYPTCANLQSTPRADQVPFQTAAAAAAAGYQPCDRCQPAPVQDGQAAKSDRTE